MDLHDIIAIFLNKVAVLVFKKGSTQFEGLKSKDLGNPSKILLLSLSLSLSLIQSINNNWT